MKKYTVYKLVKKEKKYKIEQCSLIFYQTGDIFSYRQSYFGTKIQECYHNPRWQIIHYCYSLRHKTEKGLEGFIS